MKKKELDKEKNYFDISVIVATYNPKLDKLFYTLDSLIIQKDVYMEVIITDDGSKDNLFNEVKEYFEKHNFKSYILIDHKENRGTVLNVYDGLNHSSGKYIKLISPGDALSDEYILCDWIKHLKESGRKWSFSDAYYYKNEKNEKQLCQNLTNPRTVRAYIKKDDKKCKIKYLIYDEFALGAAILCEKDIMYEYFKKIVNKVIYAEDNIYRLMVFNNIVADYYPEKTIFYEYGNGISTSSNKENSLKISNDYYITVEIMKDIMNEDDLFQKKVIYIKEKRKKKKMVFEYYFSIFWFVHFFRTKVIKSKTQKKIERRDRNASS